MSYSGKYRPTNPRKYNGDPRNIVYRSLWERKFMVYCDSHDHIIEWGSEEFSIPYRDPVSGRRRRYFPDFYIKYVDGSKNTRRMVIEVKPARQCKEPVTNPSKKTKTWMNEVYTWGVNQAKWKAAKDFCDDRLWEFKIFTEKELGIK